MKSCLNFITLALNVRNKKRVLLIVVLLATFLRIGANIARQKVFFDEPFLCFGKEAYARSMQSDSVWYDGIAKALLKGKGLLSMSMKRLSYERFAAWVDVKKIDETYYAHKAVMPLYPLFLALFYYIGGINTLSYFIPQLILAASTCLLIYLLAKAIFNEKVGILAAFMVAFYPDLIFWTYPARTETLFIFLLGLGFLLLYKGNLRENSFLIFMSAIAFGLATLTRITFIFFIPVLFIWEVFFFKEEGKKSLYVGLVMLLLMILVLLPWCVRNFIVFDKFTPFSDEVYTFLKRPNSAEVTEGEYYFWLNNSLFTRVIGFIRANPKEYLLSSVKRFLMFWSPLTAPMKTFAKVYKGITWLIVFPAAFWGMLASLKTWRKSGLLILFIFYHSLFHAASFVDTGLIYRYPIQPFLCIFSAYSFWMIYRKAKPGYA